MKKLIVLTLVFALALVLCGCGVISLGTLSLTETAALIAVVWLLAVILHAANIKRLLSGKENKIFLASYFEKRDEKRGEKREIRKENRAEKREERKNS